MRSRVIPGPAAYRTKASRFGRALQVFSTGDAKPAQNRGTGSEWRLMEQGAIRSPVGHVAPAHRAQPSDTALGGHRNARGYNGALSTPTAVRVPANFPAGVRRIPDSWIAAIFREGCRATGLWRSSWPLLCRGHLLVRRWRRVGSCGRTVLTCASRHRAPARHQLRRRPKRATEVGQWMVMAQA